MTVAPLGVGPAGVGRGGQPRARRRSHGPAAAADAARRTSRRADDLHRVGTVAIIRQMAKAPTGMRVLVEGSSRARAEFLQNERGFIRALIKPLPEAVGALDRDRRARPAAAGAGRPRAVAGDRPVARHQDARDEPRRSAAHRLPAGQPARHEGGGQAAAARGEQHRGQARRGLDGALARDRRARAEGARSNRRPKRK